MTLKTIILYFSLAIIFLSLHSCTESKAIIFTYSYPINDSQNLYIYHQSSFTHSSDEDYFAIGKNYCDVYTNDKNTFAKTFGLVQIDTIISGKVKVITSSKIEFLRERNEISLEINDRNPEENMKPIMHYFMNADSCK